MIINGNFGKLQLTIEGNKAKGIYQEHGSVSGNFSDGKFTGIWKNKGLEGLIEFSIVEGILTGSWKKGLDSGPMKGKWWGEVEQIPEELIDNKETTVDELFHQAVEILKSTGDISIESISDKLKIGKNRASRIYDQICHSGLVNTKTPNSETSEALPSKTESPVISHYFKLNSSKDVEIACSLAVIMRNLMLADNEVHDEEIYWMQNAFDFYEDKYPLRNVWDDVDEYIQKFEKLNLHGHIIDRAVQILKIELNEDEKNEFLPYLIKIIGSDNHVTYEEFIGMQYVLEGFFPGNTDQLIGMFLAEGITVDTGI